MSVIVEASADQEHAQVRKTASARRMRLARWGAGCFAWVGGIAILIAGSTWLFLHSLELADQRIREEALARARASGTPLTREEIAAFAAKNLDYEGTTRRWRRTVSEVDLERFRGPDAMELPLVGYDRMDDGADPPTRDRLGRMAGEDLRLAKEFASGFRDAFEAARWAREGEPPADARSGSESESDLTHQPIYLLASLRTALHLDAEVRLAEGDVDGAVDDLLSMLAIDEPLRAYPFEWSHWTRRQSVEQNARFLERTLAVESLDDEHLRRLGEACRTANDVESFQAALAGARVNFVDWVQLEDDQFAQSFGIERAARSRGGDLAKGLDCLAEIEQASEESVLAAAKTTKRLNDELTTLAADPVAASRYPATLFVVPQTLGLANDHLQAEAQLALSRTAIACERYRLMNGRLPAKLDDLVPEYLDSVPLDPFDEQPLRYRSDASGVRLYSIGPDFADDGGGAATGSAVAMFKSSDVIFRLKTSRSKEKASSSESMPQE